MFLQPTSALAIRIFLTHLIIAFFYVFALLFSLEIPVNSYIIAF